MAKILNNRLEYQKCYFVDGCVCLFVFYQNLRQTNVFFIFVKVPNRNKEQTLFLLT